MFLLLEASQEQWQKISKVLGLITFDNVEGNGISVDPFPASWREGSIGSTQELAVCSGAQSETKQHGPRWAEGPDMQEFEALLSDSDEEVTPTPQMPRGKATSTSKVPRHASGSSWELLDMTSNNDSDAYQVCSPSLLESDENLEDLLHTPPLTASYHGITQSAKPTGKAKAKGKKVAKGDGLIKSSASPKDC